MKFMAVLCLVLILFSATGCSNYVNHNYAPSTEPKDSQDQDTTASEAKYRTAKKQLQISLGSALACVALAFAYAETSANNQSQGGETWLAIGAGLTGLASLVTGITSRFSTIKAGQLANDEWREALQAHMEQDHEIDAAIDGLGPSQNPE